MHYYAHHIGDFTRDTLHLEPIEECYYRRALDLYYKTEGPLDSDLAEVCRLLRAKTASQKKVVRNILDEFFILQEDGYHQSRCDREIAEYALLEPERAAASAAKKDNVRERKRRSRERRSQLFAFLREHNIVPDFKIKMDALQSLVDEVTSRTGHAPVTRDLCVTNGIGHSNVTGDGTANQNPKPVTSNQNNSLSVPGEGDQGEDVTRKKQELDAQTAAEIERLSRLPALELSQDRRMVTWSQLNYDSLPDHWRALALKAYPDLNEASLKAMFIGCAGKCAGMTGRQQPAARWDAEWSYTLSMLAEEKLKGQQRNTGDQKRSSKAPSRTNLHPNQDWNNQPPPDYADMPPVDVSDMEF